jgi:hypothetical protein
MIASRESACVDARIEESSMKKVLVIIFVVLSVTLVVARDKDREWKRGTVKVDSHPVIDLADPCPVGSPCPAMGVWYNNVIALDLHREDGATFFLIEHSRYPMHLHKDEVILFAQDKRYRGTYYIRMERGETVVSLLPDPESNPWTWR